MINLMASLALTKVKFSQIPIAKLRLVLNLDEPGLSGRSYGGPKKIFSVAHHSPVRENRPTNMGSVGPNTTVP